MVSYYSPQRLGPMTYKVVIGKIFTSPHPNADKIQIGHICGFRVIVGLDTQDGDLYAFFDCDGQLSEEFAQANDLIRRKDENGNPAGGFFEESRRVRAQPFRGVRSEGFAVPLEYFAFTGYDISDFKEGDSFEELNNIPIACKYVTRATKAAQAKNINTTNPLKAAFPQHYDTVQYRFAHIPEQSLIVITEKEHGTSVRYGKVTVERERQDIWSKILSRLGIRRTTRRLEYVLGTRRAILDGKDYEYKGGFYGNGEPYTIAPRKLNNRLKDDEIIYGEVVGYCSNGSPLFTHSLTKLPELEKQYGSPIEYSYGCPKGEARLRIYRITLNGRDLSWFEVEKRAEELGVETVTEMDRFVFDGNKDALDARIQGLLEGPSLVDPTHLREGVCIYVQDKNGIRVYKEKSYSFKLAEGIVKDNDNYVDAEEIA